MVSNPKGRDHRKQQHLIAVRVNAELLGAIDSEVKRLRDMRPGAHIQRSDALREVLYRALISGGTVSADSQSPSDTSVNK